MATRKNDGDTNPPSPSKTTMGKAPMRCTRLRIQPFSPVWLGALCVRVARFGTRVSSPLESDPADLGVRRQRLKAVW